jgi:hypothetical protein
VLSPVPKSEGPGAPAKVDFLLSHPFRKRREMDGATEAAGTAIVEVL